MAQVAVNRKGIGLIIAQNAMQQRAKIYSLDKHFLRIPGLFPVEVL